MTDTVAIVNGQITQLLTMLRKFHNRRLTRSACSILHSRAQDAALAASHDPTLVDFRKTLQQLERATYTMEARTKGLDREVTLRLIEMVEDLAIAWNRRKAGR